MPTRRRTGGPGGFDVLLRNLAAATTATVDPPAPLGSFDTAHALQSGDEPLCRLAPPAW